MKKLGMKKVWVPVIALCSVGLIVGTGYAAWTISRNEKGEATGNRKADTVSDTHISVKNVQWYQGETKLDKNPTVTFGYTETKVEGVSGSWLTNTSDIKEDRSFSLHFDVEKGTDITKDLDISVSREVTDKDKAFVNCVTSSLIAAPGTDDGTHLKYTLSAGDPTPGDNNVASYVCDVTFKWGAHFILNGAPVNPISFYNNFDSKSWGEFIKDKSGYNSSMYQDFTDCMGKVAKLNSENDVPNFKITISATAKNA